MRLRFTARAVMEYEAYPKDYDTDDPAEMIRMDQETAEEDTYLFLDQGDVEWTVKIEEVKFR